MLNIVCVQAGNYLGRGAEYVNILVDGILRNLEEGTPGRFICFTDDDPSKYAKCIEVRPLPADLPGWWQKLALFKDGLFTPGDRIAYFDLDTLITGPLDDIVAYDGDFAILEDFYRPGGFQSSVMLWRAGMHSHIWESYVAAGCPTSDPAGDQAWIERSPPLGARFLQQLFPGAFVSYKLLQTYPLTQSVVCFHGLPRPHEVVEGWVQKVWRMNGITRAELKIECNTKVEAILANVKSACKRDLPWFDFDYSANDGHAVIVGGGPSVADCVNDLRMRKQHGQKIWAMNNAAHWLIDQGIIPDAHFIVDAREENAYFVRPADQHPDTVYYIGSQCHPKVFDALEGRKVILWHVQSEGIIDVLKDVKDKPVHLVGGGNTVALHALSMAFLMGFRKIHLYGVDSSRTDDAHHVYEQKLNDTDVVLDVLYGERHFQCSPWMVTQAQEFLNLQRTIRECGTIVTVHGYGLIPSMFYDDLAFSPLTMPDIRAAEILRRLEGVENPVGVEIGVFAGNMSRSLLADERLRLYMVDSWEGDGAAYTDKDDWHATLTQFAQDGYMREAQMRTEFAEQRRTIVRDRSDRAAIGFVDGSLDFVFIDADHGYAGCRRDIETWMPKVRPGGWLCGHDYRNTERPFPGVDRAVDEFIAAEGLTLEVGENFTWFARIPARATEKRDAA